jgi:hypothetical protein
MVGVHLANTGAPECREEPAYLEDIDTSVRD